MTPVPINYLAILLSGIVAVGIGFLWYGPLFGKAWMKSAGLDAMTPEQRKIGMKKMPVSTAIQFIGAVVMAWVFAHAFVFANSYLGTGGVPGGIMTGFMSWLGFVAPASLGVVLWEGRSWKYWGITVGYWLVTLIAMGIVLALMPA